MTEEHFSAAISTLNPNCFSDLRNLAIFMLAFDSGARLSELINLKVGDVDLLQRCAKVMGKGGRERIIFFGNLTAQTIKEYLLRRTLLLGQPSPSDFLFVFTNNSPLTGVMFSGLGIVARGRQG